MSSLCVALCSRKVSHAPVTVVECFSHCAHFLQLPTAVDVVGSREATPVPEMVEVAPDRVSVEVAPDRVSVELESLSKASRQFLEVREILAQNCTSKDDTLFILDTKCMLK